MVIYSAVSSPLDRSKRFTLSSPCRPVHSDTVLGFSLKHSSHAAIVHLPVPKINSPGGADTASGEYTELRSVA